MSGSFKVQLLFGGSFMEAGAQRQTVVKLRLVEWTELTVLAFARFCSRVLMFLLHIMIKDG